MKKRILAILLTVFLLAGLLPTAALADDGMYVNSYEAFVEKINAGQERIYILDDGSFTWPSEEVVLDVNSVIYAPEYWVIPSNVTINLAQKTSGTKGGVINCTHLVVQGTVNATNERCITGDVDLREGGVITSTGEIYVGINNIWSLDAGAELDASLRLDGTIKGNGSTVNGNITVWAGYMSTNADVVFSGDLTLAGTLTVHSTMYTLEQDNGYSTIVTIPEGSHVTAEGKIYLGNYQDVDSANAARPEYTYAVSHPGLQVYGELDLNSKLVIADGARLYIYEYATVNMSSESEIAYESTGGTDETIMGNGTLLVTVDMDDNGRIVAPSIFKNFPLDESFMENPHSVCPNIGQSINLSVWRSWIDCDHDWSDWEVTKEATCGEEGVMSRTCSKCGTTENETIPATGEHTPDGNTDCEKETLCTVCGAVIKEAGEHTWNEGEVTTEPTCGEKGETTYTCTVCGATKTEDIDPTGNHTWDEGVITTEPTCTEEGVKTYTCTVCGETKTEAVPTVEHTPDGNTDCEKATYCTVCGAVIKPAGEHDWDDGEVTVEPTCTEEGEKTFTCVNCGATKTETVEALGHELTYTAGGSTITETCTRCDHTATANVTAENAVYTGEAIENAQVVTSEDWSGGEVTVTYENNVNAGTATATITVEGATASVEFTIAKATEYTVELDNLNQYTNNLGAVTATVTPKDETAVIIVEYGTDVAEVPCNHEHTEECGEDGETCTHTEHDEECGFAEASTEWNETAPTAAGTYKVRARVESSDNLVVSEELVYTEGTLVITRYVAPSRPSTTTPTVTTPATPEPEPVNAAEVYNDVEETDWYIESVNYVVENGLMNGYDEETFAPNDNLSRAMLMTIIARIDGVDTEGGENWYEAGMAWAVENGITDGSNPLANITREQLVTMLYRYIGSPEVSGELNFKDVSEISDYATAAMTWAVQNGIIQGSDVGTVNPQSNATRAEAAAILARFCESVKK